MKKKIWLMVVIMAMCIFAFATAASAERYGRLTYEVIDGEVTITDCRVVTEVEIPEMIDGYPVTKIGDGAFRDCDSLTSITIPDSVTSIGDEAFRGCGSLTNIAIPDSVTSIGKSAFHWCTNLTSIVIPDGVTSIGDWVFSHCDSLTSITIPDSVISIGNYAFAYSDSLISIVIPNGVISIGEGAFYDCNNLTSIAIPEGIISIGNHAFSLCINLTSIAIPNSVTSIGDGDVAFADCSSLTSITVAENNQYYSSLDGVLFDKEQKTIITYPSGKTNTHYVIPDGVTSIGRWTFRGCNSLIRITIPNGVTSIGDEAFSACSSLTSITIPGSVKNVDLYAFNYCGALETVYYIGTEEEWNDMTIGEYNEPLTSANIIFLDSAADVSIVGATSTDDSLKFISRANCNDEAPMKSFGTTFIPLWLFEDSTATPAVVEYDNSQCNIEYGQTFGATLTAIPESCKDMNIVGKSFFVRANGDYVWSDAKTASVNDTNLADVK